MPDPMKMTAGKMVSKSKQSRPATSGHKKIRTGTGGQMSAEAQETRVKPIIKANLKGPFC